MGRSYQPTFGAGAVLNGKEAPKELREETRISLSLVSTESAGLRLTQGKNC